MRFLFCFLFTIGCSHKKEPMPSDTLFLDKNRDWYHLYEQELKTAIDNEDDVAFHFFWPEYLKVLSDNNKRAIIRVID
jgi:hypothetical protein